MYKKPIYLTRIETFLAEDKIIPYGERMRVSSEKREEEMALKLLGAYEDIDEDED